jgi:ribosomal 30S subunit maturation factor RimM
VLKFAGFDSIDEAKALVGYELAVPAAEVASNCPKILSMSGIDGMSGRDYRRRTIGKVAA